MVWQRIFYNSSSITNVRAVAIAPDDPSTVFAAAQASDGTAAVLKTTGGAA